MSNTIGRLFGGFLGVERKMKNIPSPSSPPCRAAFAVPAALLAAMAVPLASCAFPIGPDWKKIIDNVSSTQTNDREFGSHILNYDLQAYVPVPVVGAVPVKGITNRQDMDITVVWKDGENKPVGEPFGAFVLNAVYQADIKLTAKEGFSFDPAISFTYPQGAVDAQPEDPLSTGERTLSTVTYKRTAAPLSIPAADLDLADHIPAPVTGAGMVAGFCAGTYGGTVVWELGELVVRGFFREGMVYTAKVHLYAAPGYTLTGSALTHTGGDTLTVLTSWDNTGSAITGMTIVFPATSNGAAIPVSDLEITEKVPAPVSGGIPVTYFAAPQYTGTAVWSAGGTPFTGMFQAGTVYTAKITLTAVSGYTFEGTGVNAITHRGGATVTNKADSGVVSVTFPETSSVAAVPVSDLDLTYKVPAPVNGGTPVTYFSAPQYTGNVDWSVTGGEAHSGLFASSTEYTAKVALTAASGYTLEGTGANAITHRGGTTVTNKADSGVVSVTFPETDSVAAAVVGDLDLTYKVPAPVKDGTPVTYFATPQYTGNVNWSVTGGGAHGGPFTASTEYTAKVTLTAASGYTFGDPVATFTHGNAASPPAAVDNGNGTITVSVAFPETTAAATAVVYHMDLTYTVPVPVKDGTPVTYFATPQYTGNVDWSVTGGGAHSGLFAAGTEYTATVTLAANTGWTFTGRAGNFTHRGTSLTTTEEDYRRLTVIIPFPPTEVLNETPAVIDLTNLVPTPLTGATPVTVFLAETYSGNVVWTTGGTVAALFKPNTVYTAAITLTPAAGYVFPAAVEVTHGSFSAPDLTGSSLQVTITFPETGFLWYYSGPFSGDSTVDMDSVIDAVRAAKATGHSSVYFMLDPRMEEVGLLAGTDLLATGLVLNSGNSPAAVTIDGGKRTVRLTAASGNPVITVGSGITLTLRNITFTGMAANTAVFIRVLAGGTLILETGALITGNAGGGVSVAGVTNGAVGTLILEAGALITGNTGDSGVIIEKGAFTMKGGTVSGNGGAASGVQGVGVRMTGGAFTMDGGTISGNKTASGSVVNIAGGAFTMNDGTISNNTGGVVLRGGTFTMNGGTISENNGSGVSIQGSGTMFTMRGGAIKDNEAASGGGGVLVTQGAFIMEDGTISGNTADSGGGVFVRNNAAFTKTGGAIYGSDGGANANTARNGTGHAVIYNNGAKKRDTTAWPTVTLDIGTGDNWE